MAWADQAGRETTDNAAKDNGHANDVEAATSASRNDQPDASAPSSPTPGPPSSEQTQGRSAAATTCLQSFAAAFFTITLLAFIMQQLYFADTWSRACDYDIKLFNLVWLLYGIQPVFVEGRCDAVSGGWGLVLWWLDCTFIVILPCFCFCLILALCTWLSVPGVADSDSDRNKAMPDELMQQLTLKKFRDVHDPNDLEAAMAVSGNGTGLTHIQQQPQPQQQQQQPPPFQQQAAAPIPLRNISDIAMAFTTVSFPEPSQLRRGQSANNTQRGLTPNDATRVEPGATVVGKRKRPACPICFSEYEPDDWIIEMPCDRRHIFHEECVKAWLSTSQQCPVCRRNIAEIMTPKAQGDLV